MHIKTPQITIGPKRLEILLNLASIPSLIFPVTKFPGVTYVHTYIRYIRTIQNRTVKSCCTVGALEQYTKTAYVLGKVLFLSDLNAVEQLVLLSQLHKLSFCIRKFIL